MILWSLLPENRLHGALRTKISLSQTFPGAMQSFSTVSGVSGPALMSALSYFLPFELLSVKGQISIHSGQGSTLICIGPFASLFSIARIPCILTINFTVAREPINMIKKLTRVAVLSSVLAAGQASAFNIVLSNDDGWSSDGIQAMKKALVDSGHSVVL